MLEHSQKQPNSPIDKLSVSIEVPYKALSIGKELGRGGFGTVYQGTYHYNEVAIKQLHLGKLSRETLEEFQNESKIMWNARSPNIVQLYGTCSLQAPYCLVMEWMKGGSLYEYLQKDKSQDIPWTLRINIGTDVAKGVLALHENNILHRDLKGLNVLLDEQLKAKLTDFGLSKIKAQTASTSKNEVAGTLAWMAPELFQRKAVFTQKSDMYSYGMVLWELAARDVPFKDAHGNQALVMQWVSQGEREEIPNETPATMKQLITQCWEAKPKKRPDAKMAVETLLKHSGGLNKNLTDDNKNSNDSRPSYLGNLNSALNTSLASSPDYRGNLYSEARETLLPVTKLATKPVNSPSVPTIKTTSSVSPSFFTPAPFKKGGRYKESPIQTLGGHTSGVRAIAVLPNGDVVSGSYDKTLKVWNVKSGKCLQTLKGHTLSVEAIAVLPNGDVVSGSEDQTLKVWDVKSGKCLQTLTGHTSWVKAIVVLPNGDVVSGSEDQTLKVWNVKSGKCLQTLTGHTSWVYAIAVLPNGDVVSGSGDDMLKVWDVKSGKCLQTLEGHMSYVSAIAVLPNGDVVSGSLDQTLKVWNVKSGKCLQTLKGHMGGVNAIAVLPNGDVVSGSADDTLKVWDVKSGKCLQTLTGHTSWVYAIAVLPNGDLVSGSRDKTLKVWALEGALQNQDKNEAQNQIGLAYKRQ